MNNQESESEVQARDDCPVDTDSGHPAKDDQCTPSILCAQILHSRKSRDQIHHFASGSYYRPMTLAQPAVQTLPWLDEACLSEGEMFPLYIKREETQATQ